MATLVRERSKITAKGQTTVPKAVRHALGGSYGGEIADVVDEGGRVSLFGPEDESDPVIDAFLSFLARDMAHHPAAIMAFPVALAERMAALTAGMNVDSKEEIDGPVTL